MKWTTPCLIELKTIQVATGYCSVGSGPSGGETCTAGQNVGGYCKGGGTNFGGTCGGGGNAGTAACWNGSNIV